MTWLSALLLLLASIAHPNRARCAPHWWLAEGVRSDGSFVCAWLPPEPDGDRELDATSPEVESRVYCTGGTKAIQVRGVEVGCQPDGWR